MATRFRVRNGQQEWSDKGPDLLRLTGNARDQVKTLARMEPDLETQVNSEERRDARLADVVDRFTRYAKAAKDGDTFKVYSRGNLKSATICVKFSIPDINTDAPVKLINALIQKQFPGSTFLGGFVCKQITGSINWSDHAWRDAIDRGKGTAAPNDKITDWCARMARSSNMRYDYLLGSRDGHVVIVSKPDYFPEPSSASSTHLNHNHISEEDHDGARPPCAG